MTWGCYQVKKDPPGMYSTSRVFQLPGRVFEGMADFICRDINKLPTEKYAERIVFFFVPCFHRGEGICTREELGQGN